MLLCYEIMIDWMVYARGYDLVGSKFMRFCLQH